MEMALQPGSSLGEYELLVRIGRGGMASVWVARDRSAEAGHGRLVAVKAMLPELAHDSEFRAMFLEEGQIVRSIDHPNVVRVYGVGEDRGILYLAMDWVEGDSLRAIVREAKKHGPLPLPVAVRVIGDAAAGLHAAHELRGWDGELRNVVHCDISPHNVLVGTDGVAKLVDFGVANATIHSDFGGSEKVKGKLGYMSPEQARMEPLDRRSDVFALGIVLFELTTGERLYQGESPAHTLSLVESAHVPEPASLRPGYPPELAAIVRRALARERDARFQSARELAQALEGFLASAGISVPHAAVGSLVRRLQGPRIEGVRRELRQALIGGGEPPRQTPAHSLPPGTGSFSAVPSRLPESPRESSAQPLSGTPRPETYDTPPPARAGVLPWLSAVSGICAAAASIWWVSRPLDPGSLGGVAAASAPAPLAQAQTQARPSVADGEVARGVDVGSIPIAEPSQAASTSGLRAASRAAERTPRRGAATDEVEPSAASAEEIELAEEPAIPEVVLDETPENPYRKPGRAEPATPPVDTSGPKGPFNRGVALAQLSSSASRAGSCRKSGGPSGAGRATVTFSSDGVARAVSVSAPFSGTPVGLCVAEQFRASRVPPFTGSPVTLPWSFRIAE